MSRSGSAAAVVVLSPSTEDGGVESYLRILSTGLIGRGVEVTVVLPICAGIAELRADLRAAGVRVSSMSYEWSSPQSSIGVVRQIARDLVCAARSLRRARRARLVLMLPHPEASPGLVLGAGLLRRRSIVVNHLVPPDLRVSRGRSALYTTARRLGVHWVCVSQQNAGVLAGALGWPEHNITTIHNGVPSIPWPTDDVRRLAARQVRETLELPLSARIVLSVARLNRQKGHDIIVDGIPTVLSRVPDAFWVWAGDGPERDALSTRAKRLGVDHRLILLGRRNSVERLLLGSDVFVFPSRYEGFGLAAVEAQMAGLPVIVSNAGPLPEIVRADLDGIVIPSESSEALAAATVQVLHRPEQARERARRAARRVREEFTSDRMVDQTLAMVLAVCTCAAQ